MLQEITVEFIYHFMLIFARLGVAFSIFPAINDHNIPMRARLIFALVVTFLLLPVVSSFLPKYPEKLDTLVSFLAIEMIIGLLISIAAKFYFLTIHVIGQIISMQSGLGAATFFDPSQKSQISIFSTFLFLLTIVFIFVSDTHYLFIGAVIDSYDRFPPGELLEISDMSKFVVRVLNDGFILAFKISSPFLVVSLAILVGSGILARLMPNLQVFFVITPAQILVMFCVFYIVMNASVSKVVEYISISTNTRDF